MAALISIGCFSKVVTSRNEIRVWKIFNDPDLFLNYLHAVFNCHRICLFNGMLDTVNGNINATACPFAGA